MYEIPLVRQYENKVAELLNLLTQKPEHYWTQRGESEALRLFRAMSHRVPAYKDFLKKHGVQNPDSVRTMKDFQGVPIASKENYLLQYPLPMLCWDGIFSGKQWIIASTSGSTGNPFYFPRTNIHDKQCALSYELCFRAYYGIDAKSTLFINCFALGVWIGGMFVYQAMKHHIEKNRYPFSIITPGADQTEALKAIKNLAPQFDQIILAGYGPLVKDLIDEGAAQGIKWNEYPMKYLFAAEGFTEGFRDYMKTHGGAQDIYGGTLNVYGTADLGTMAHETPLSILMRRLTVERPELCQKIFSHSHKLPTLAQYIPELYYFEEVDGRLVCSSPGGIPLVRYDLKDRGEVQNIDALFSKLAREGVNIQEEMSERAVAHPVWRLPLVAVYERNDFTVSIYSVNIYPESIRKALEDKNLQTALTGKFTMTVGFNEQQNQVLEIHLELRPRIAAEPKLEKQALDAIVSGLNKENSEWRDFYANPNIRQKIAPRLTFWPHQHPQYFKPGGKQKWVKRS